MTGSMTEYETAVDGARRALTEEATMRALLDPGIDPLLLERFLIQFSALGVQMTRPVDGWIRRAGQRCIELGLKELGESLVKHAKHEAGHDLMLVDDTRLLVDRWNQRGMTRLDAEQLISSPATAAVRTYISIHEETIASDMPYGQVAIELEIERMSTIIGPRQIEQCKAVLGPQIMSGLSFIKEHVAVDVGHTALNQKMLQRLLVLRPDAAARLAEIGASALRAYIRFFGECLNTASEELATFRAARISA